MNDVFISVIVLVWNTDTILVKCLEHLRSQRFQNFETIIIDNGSENCDYMDSIAKQNSDYKMIRNDSNMGYSKGMNQGISIACGNYIMPLNVDAFLDEYYLERAVYLIKKFPDIGMIGGKIFRYINGGKTEIIDQTGNFLRKRISVTWKSPGNEQEFAFGPNGCCPIFSKKMLDDIKHNKSEYFDELYFFYGEDIDLYWRAQWKGWNCIYSPALIAYHMRSASLGGAIKFIDKPVNYQKEALKNRLITIFKNLSPGLFFYLFPYLLFTEILMWPYFLVKIPGNVRELFGAYREVYCLFDDIALKRRQIQSGKRVSSKSILRYFISC